MKQVLVLILVFCLACSQTVNNVRVVNHVGYITNVLQKTVSELEHREWCNLKLPDFVIHMNETVIDRHYEGTVTYTNGFLLSVQQVDILQSSVQQVWTWNTTQQAGTVALRGTLRFTDLAVGYDVIAEMVDGNHRYTAIFSHPLISFAFNIFYSIENENIDSVTAVATVPRVTHILPDIFPKDTTSDVLTALFNSEDTAAGIMAWGPDVFVPITTEIATHAELPTICYDCPVV